MSDYGKIWISETGSDDLHLYLLSCKPYVKIGVTKDLQKRYYNIQASTPYEITVFTYWTAPDAFIRWVEKTFIQQHSQFHHRNEWFKMRPVKAEAQVMKLMAHRDPYMRAYAELAYEEDMRHQEPIELPDHIGHARTLEQLERRLGKKQKTGAAVVRANSDWAVKRAYRDGKLSRAKTLEHFAKKETV